VELSSIDGREGQAEAVRNAINEQERRRRFARTRVDLLREYAETRGCRRRFLLNALGEEFEAPCAACDNCLSGVTQEMSADVIDGPFRLNDTVVHSTFGHGEVTRVEREVVGVRFEIAGYKTFALPEVIDLGLLKTFAPEPELA
jgi:ATP-dependent DNA helicase RecQ